MALPEKYTNCSRYMNFISSCKEKEYTPDLTIHSHHIVPKHDGGLKIPEKENLVDLSVRDHMYAHKILYEEFGDIADYLSLQYLTMQWGDKTLKEEVNQYYKNHPEISEKLSHAGKERHQKMSKKQKKEIAKKIGTSHRTRNEEDKKKTSKKASKIMKDFWKNLSPEKRKEMTAKSRKNSLSGEAASKNIKKWLSRRTPEQKKIQYQKIQETKKKNGIPRKKLSPEQRKLMGIKMRETRIKNKTVSKWSDKITKEMRREHALKIWESRRKNQLEKELNRDSPKAEEPEHISDFVVVEKPGTSSCDSTWVFYHRSPVLCYFPLEK